MLTPSNTQRQCGSFPRYLIGPQSEQRVVYPFEIQVRHALYDES